MGAANVLIAEDEPLTRLGIRAMLERYPAEYTVVGEAVTGEEAVRLADDLQPDLIIMDIRMPQLNGLEATRQIIAAHPHILVLILTMADETESLFAALHHGAKGYIVKGADQEDMLRAIRAVLRGQAVFSPEITQRLLHIFSNLRYQPDVMPPLSARETEILSLMARSSGSAKYVAEAIAEQLVIARHTVQNHISNILVKLQVSTREEAIRKWREWEQRRQRTQ